MPVSPIRPGAILAQRYDILRLIGAGGMGDVYETHDRTLGIAGALKILKGSSRDAAARARFRSEVVLARKVRHRNVCAIHDYGTDGDLDFISMELVAGQDLRHLLREQGPLDWERAYEVALQVCEGLLAIHEAGIIHRDLKPANLMLEPQGLVKVMDFGVAKVGTTLAEPHTQTGMVVGTPEYMSPEQVRGGEIDFRSDLYALGVVLYEMFTGKVPFHAETPVGTMLLQLEEPLPLEPAPPRLPGPLVAVLRRALAKHPAERFGSAAEMREALTAARDASRDTDAVPVLEDEVGSGERPTELRSVSPRPSATLPPEARLLLPMLARALQNPQGDIRLQAARAIALHGRSGALAIPSLEALAADPLAEVREMAALALRQIGPPDSSAPASPDRVDSPPAEEGVASGRPEVRAGPASDASRARATQDELEAPVAARDPPAPAPEPSPPKEDPRPVVMVVSPPVSTPPSPRRPAPASAPQPPPVARPSRPASPRRPEPPVAVSGSPAVLPVWRHPIVLALAVATLVFAAGRLIRCAPAAPPSPATQTPAPGEGVVSPPATALPTTTTLPPTATTTLPPTTTTTVFRKVVGGAASPSTSTTTTTTSTTAEPTTTTTSSSTTTTTLQVTTTTTLRPVRPGDQIRSDDPLAQPPECERCPPVPYPDIAKDPRVAAEGRVEMRLLVDERGTPTILDAVYRPLPSRRAAVAAGQKVLVEAATSGVKKWLYRPARKDGVLVRMEVRAIVEFRLGQ